MTEELEIQPTRQSGSAQTIIERGLGKDEQATVWSYGTALFRFRLLEVAWWMIPVPILFGRWLVVAATAFFLWRFLQPMKQRDDKVLALFWILLGVGAVIGLVVLDAVPWYPIRWGWRDGRMPLTLGQWTVNLPQWFLILRVFLLVAPTLAWYSSVRFVKWRYRLETVAPTASGVPIQQARASSVKPPSGSPVHFIDPDADPPPVINYEPVRPVPFRAAPKAKRVPLLETRSGATIEGDMVLEMLEWQRTNAGFAYLTWKGRGWTRSQWKTACEWLAEWDLITQPVKGQSAKLLVSVDDAVDFTTNLLHPTM